MEKHENTNICASIMSLKDQVHEIVEKLPATALGSSCISTRTSWLEFVLSEQQTHPHPPFFYIVVARLLAEYMGYMDAQDYDYGVDHMRSNVLEVSKVGAKPVDGDIILDDLILYYI